ncbi:MAG: GlsB/YeaQ/YmgE family stress response membrane protein [Actinomycetota bacterium]|nr:GlsB/YeaQ/YmgE family stress response membrane protein [Actinomycetota bacterium]
MLLYVIGLIISGLIVGALARLALPGKDPMSIPMTIGIGIAGSFVGGLIVAAVTGGRSYGGIVVSVAVATFFVWLMRRRRGGSITDPAAGGRGRRF